MQIVQERESFLFFSSVGCDFGYLEKCLNLLLDFGSETGNVHHGVPANRRENGARNHWAGSSVSSGVLGRQPPSNRFLTSCGLLVSDFVKNVHYFVLS